MWASGLVVQGSRATSTVVPRPDGAGAQGAALVLDREKSGTGFGKGFFCPTPVRGLRLQGPDGRRLLIPCGKRSCPPCQKRADDELARVLLADAKVDPPGWAITLTTSDPDTPAAVFREGNAQVWRALRKEFGRVEYAGFVEFTTGAAPRSGGLRRMHSHNLVKADRFDQPTAEAIVREVWERVTGAYVVDVAALMSRAGAIAYVGIHHRKPEQQPPADWRGMTTRWSRGYLHRPIAVMRQEARDELRRERFRWRAEQEAWRQVAAQMVDPETRKVRPEWAPVLEEDDGIEQLVRRSVDAWWAEAEAEREAHAGSWRLVAGVEGPGGVLIAHADQRGAQV